MAQVVLEDHDTVALLRLTNGVINAIGVTLVDELSKTVQEIAGRYHGLVLAGNSKFFSIGLDVPTLLTCGRSALADFWNRFENLVLALYTLPIPTACAIRGHATGGGAILALACDYRFMANGNRRLALNEVKIGVPVPYLADLMLRQITTDRVAVEMEFCSSFLGPEEAKAAGLADAIGNEDIVENQALKKIKELAEVSQAAFAITKSHRTREIPSRFNSIRQDLSRGFLDCWFEPATQKLLAEAAQKF
jgi:enoyl-CoA hydratase/carnithine racemase